MSLDEKCTPTRGGDFSVDSSTRHVQLVADPRYPCFQTQVPDGFGPRPITHIESIWVSGIPPLLLSDMELSIP